MLTLLVASLTPAAVATVPRAEIAPNVWMPLLAAGTWQYNDSVAASSVANAIAAGFTHIDTALDYGNQRGVSAGLARSGVARDEIFITTKIPGCGFTGINPRTCASDTLAAAKDNVVQLSSSYPALQQVDLMLLHFPPCVSAPPGLPSPINSTCCAQKTGCSGANLDAVAQQWKAMEDALAANYTRAIGVSNFCSKCLAAATSISASPVQPAVNQFQLHVGMGSDPQRFLSHAKAAGITPQAWSPLGHGGHGSASILHGNLTRSIGAAHKKSAVQVALKWILTKGAAVVTKSSNPAHLKQDIDLFDFDLSDAEVAALDAATFAAEDTPSFMCED